MWKYMIVDKVYIPGRKNKFFCFTLLLTWSKIKNEHPKGSSIKILKIR